MNDLLLVKNNNKKRAANFSSKEEAVLVNLAKKYKNILECKLSDMRTHNEKSKVWGKIENEFNSLTGEAFRPREVLRKKYDNIKKRVKKKYADEKSYVLGTGGGPSQNTSFSEIDTTIKDILGTRIEGHMSEFDGDAETDVAALENNNAIISDIEVGFPPQSSPAHNEHNEVITFIMEDDSSEAIENGFNTSYRQEIPVIPPNINETNDSSSNSNSNWANYTPQMLKNLKSQALCVDQTSKKQKLSENFGISTRVTQWAEAKSQLEESKARFLEKEQELKLQFMREKHELELKIMKEKAALEMRLMEEESRAKIELLQKHKIKL